jgi:hypothetical protein
VLEVLQAAVVAQHLGAVSGLGVERGRDHVPPAQQLLVVAPSLLVEDPGEQALLNRRHKAAPDSRVPQDAVGGDADLGRVAEAPRAHPCLKGDEAVPELGTELCVAGPVPEVAGGREDHDEAPLAVGDLGGEAARLCDGHPRGVGAVRLLEHGVDVLVVVEACRHHVLEAVGADLCEVVLADEPAIGDEGDLADAEALLQVLHH